MENLISGFHPLFLPLSSVLFGLAVGMFVNTIFSLSLGDNEIEHGKNYDYKQSRLTELRKHFSFYRFAEKLILTLEKSCCQSRHLASIQQSLRVIDLKKLWTPELYLAHKKVQAGFIGLFVGIAVSLLTGFVFAVIPGLFVGPVLGCFVYLFLSEHAVSKMKTQADKIRNKIKERLPFVMDMLSIMLSAGASFQESLSTTAKENSEHPISYYLSDALIQMEHGRSQKQVLNEFAGRMNESTLSDLVFSINKAEELGTPLAQSLAEASDQIRLKRQQWGEKAAAEAEAKIMLPGLLTMIACMIIIVSPFILPIITAIYQGDVTF